MKSFGYNSYYKPHESELSNKFFIDDLFLSRVVEGCNAISVIVLFIAFVIAFKGSLLKTVLFAVIGSLFLYWINILRVALINVLLLKHPEQEALWHDLVFPAIIYGTVFLLWVLWVNKFSDFSKTKAH